MAYVKYDVQGNEWGVTCHELVIPQDHIEGMTAREIGEYVISLMKKIPEVQEQENREMFPYYFAHRSDPSRLNKLNRNKIYALLVERDGGAYCQVPGCTASGPYEIDHVVPKSGDGSDELDNLQLLCPHHNKRKKTKEWNAFLDELRG